MEKIILIKASNMKLILSFLILISAIAFAQENKKIIISEHELPTLKKGKDGTYEKVYTKPNPFIPPADAIIVESNDFSDSPREKSKKKPFDPDEYLAEDDTILANLNEKLKPLFSDEYVYWPLDTIDKTNTKLKLDEASKIELNDIVRKMIANGESDEDIQLVINYFKNKYGKIHLRKSQPPISSSSIFLKEFKRLALPILTIILLVFLCYRLLKNITIAKINVALKSDKANKLYKIVGITVFISAIVLWYTNPTLKEFKEITPSKLDIEKGYGFCDDEGWRLSHTKVKNNILYSYYKFSFGCMEYDRTFQKVKLTTHRDVYYIGIFNNFYRVEYP